MNLKLLFKKSEDVKEFIERSKLSKVVKTATIISFVLWGFFKFFSYTPFAKLTQQIILNPHATQENPLTLFGLFSYLFMITSLALLIFKIIFDKWLNEDYKKYRNEIENNESLFKEYEPFYFNKVKTYIDVNGAFSLSKNKTSVKVGYKRNTWFVLLITVLLVLTWIMSFICSNPNLLMRLTHNYNLEIISGSMLDLYKTINAVSSFILVLYVYYVVIRFKNFKENYINITVSELENDNYDHKWDENYLNYMQSNETLNKRATNYFNAHNKGWLRGLFCTKEDAFLFGIEIFCAFIYLVAIYYIFIIIFRICISFSPELEAKYNNYVLRKEAKSVIQETNEVKKRLVLTGNGWNQYYEIDGKYIREGLGTPYGKLTEYELHGNEIWYQKDNQWKTMAVISLDGQNGSVMYSNDYTGEKVFERYEWK